MPTRTALEQRAEDYATDDRGHFSVDLYHAYIQGYADGWADGAKYVFGEDTERLMSVTLEKAKELVK